MQQVIGELERLRTLARRLLILQRFSLLAAGTLAVLVAVIAVDYTLRLPGALRLVLLAGGVAGLGYAIWSYLRLAVVFRPTLTQLALRIEHALPGAKVSGRLASSVEFAMGGIDPATMPGRMAERSVADAQSRLAGEDLRSVVTVRRTWRDVSAMAILLAVTITFAVSNPSVAATGLKRILLPLSSTNWPARTGVESYMEQVTPGGATGVFPRGQALPLRAHVTRGPADQHVYAHYRLRTNDSWEPWERIVLTHQGADVQDGAVHERLVDSNAQAIEVYFATDDDRTEMEPIELVPPPAVIRATLSVSPPAYADGRIPPLQVELGPGIDERAVTDSPSFVGSQASLRLELNKPIAPPADEARRDSWVRTTFGLDEESAGQFHFNANEPAVWSLDWRINGTQTLVLDLVDEHGLGNTEPISYRIVAVEDRPPAVTITQPQADEVVLPTAIVPLLAEGRDDVSVSAIGLEAAVNKSATTAKKDAAATNEAAAPEWSHQQEADAPTATVEARLDLGALKVSAGDVVLVTAVANDAFELDGATHATARSPARRLRVISETEFATQLRRQLGAVRQNAIRIEAMQGEIQDDIIEDGVQPGMERAQAQVGERIAAQRQAVDDVDRLLRQNQLNDAQLSSIVDQTRDLLDHAGRASSKAVEAVQKSAKQQADSPEPSADEPQEATSDHATETDREDTSRSKPSQGAQTSGQQGQQQDSGGDQSPVAKPDSEPAGKPGEHKPQEGEPQEGDDVTPADEPEAEPNDPIHEAAPEDQPIVEAQQEVRDELSDLIKLLDRDEDTWVARRQLESMLDEQTELAQDTAQLGEQTIGKSRSELTEQQLSELDRIAMRQRELRDKSRQLPDDLRKRADALQKSDPQSAQGMRDAADRADQQQLDRDQEEAASKIEQNQMRTASAKQQSSQSTMRQMLEDMQNTKRAQAAELIRKLSSLIESIQRLVNVQENELISLAKARDMDVFTGLDRNMIRLTQNTQSVENEARTAGQETRRVARSLGRAADAQGAAVTALRAAPVGADAAETAENRSLELLKEALASAQEAQQETQELEMRRRREELIAAYRTQLEKQAEVRTQTLPLTSVAELDRRQLVDARLLAATQDEVRSGLADLRDMTQEIIDSPVFVHVHRLIDDRSLSVSESLEEGRVTVDVTDRQQFIADSIGRLITALEEALAPPEEFAKDEADENSGQPGGSGQPQEQLIPPITQLRLLRGVQELIYTQTRDIDARADLQDAQRRERMRDLGQQQQELSDLGQRMLDELKKHMPDPEVKPEPAPLPEPPVEPGAGEGEEPQPGEPQPLPNGEPS